MPISNLYDWFQEFLNKIQNKCYVSFQELKPYSVDNFFLIQCNLSLNQSLYNNLVSAVTNIQPKLRAKGRSVSYFKYFMDCFNNEMKVKILFVRQVIDRIRIQQEKFKYKNINYICSDS